MYAQNMPEEDLKNHIAHDFFKGLDMSTMGKIDFCVSYRAKTLFQAIHYLWAEAKRGNKADIVESFVQLILTIGKERTFENELPPLFLGAFDCEKIAFIPYHEMMDIFSQNDFNWNVAPSDHSTKEFRQLYAKSKDILESKKLQFDFEHDSKELREFIRENFTLENEHVHKGAFFTPQIWVQKAQEYLAKALDEDYYREYYIWDCAAGTGNLLANLTESPNLYASMLDKADVEIMKELARNKHLPLLERHIFQFDFLNDGKGYNDSSKKEAK